MTFIRRRLVGLDAEVSILECDDEHLWVRWLEPGRCHYGEQRWSVAFARCIGKCALSGTLIRRGDRVFKPAGRPPPSNADVQIRVDQIAKVLENPRTDEIWY